jgi:phage terminase large subunit
MNKSVQLEIPPKLIPVFANKYRYRGSYGGRGSAKTRTFAKMTAVRGYQYAESGRSGIILCGREFMNSLDESSMSEIKAAILSEPWLANYYEIGEKFIRSKNGRVKYVFAGLRHNLDSIKSKSNILLCWVDEAEQVSEAAWRKLVPTVREHDSEIWVTWNPESSESATHKRFRECSPEDSCIVEMNWTDNPWFPEELEKERLDDMRKRADMYNHVWEGGFLEVTDAQIFARKFTIKEFEVDESYSRPYYGLDFGFAQDPTACVECYIRNHILYIRRDAGKVKLELDDTGQFVRDRIGGIEKWTVRADSARPESISYLQRHGLPRIIGVDKWKGSVEDGIEFIKSFEMVVIHPECAATAREFRLYSYKIDKQTEEILPIVVDAHNHYIDALRYALAPLIKEKAAKSFPVMGMF